MRTTTLVTATRLDKAGFWERSLLGRSLRLIPEELRPKLAIRFDNHGENVKGLPEVYNTAIALAKPEDILLFVHDDVFIHDVFVQHRLAEALARFDVVGLAGSRFSDLRHPSWGLAFDENLNPTGWQKPDGVILSGAVSHTPHQNLTHATPPPTPEVGLYGNFPAPCDLLDGLFLAADVGELLSSGTRFDTAFDFHLYDLDFCRTASKNGLKLGTWAILCTHGSPGNFSSFAFRNAARRYLDKWNPASSLKEAS